MKWSMIGAAMLAFAAGCASRALHLNSMSRPDALAGEWIDVRHATPGDTSIWVLGADGYDGSAHVIHQGTTDPARNESRYGSWYLHGAMSDGNGRSICFAKRIGRDSATCLPFTLDTVVTPDGPRRRLIVRGYPGQHSTGDRVLIARQP